MSRVAWKILYKQFHLYFTKYCLEVDYPDGSSTASTLIMNVWKKFPQLEREWWRQVRLLIPHISLVLPALIVDNLANVQGVDRPQSGVNILPKLMEEKKELKNDKFAKYVSSGPLNWHFCFILKTPSFRSIVFCFHCTIFTPRLRVSQLVSATLTIPIWTSSLISWWLSFLSDHHYHYHSYLIMWTI